MCMTDTVAETVDQLRKLATKLEASDQLFKSKEWEKFEASLSELHPELLYVVNSLLGVVCLEDQATPVGTMKVAFQVDEDGLNAAFE